MLRCAIILVALATAMLLPGRAEAQARSTMDVRVTIVDAALASTLPTCDDCQASATNVAASPPLVSWHWSDEVSDPDVGRPRPSRAPAPPHGTQQPRTLTMTVVVP